MLRENRPPLFSRGQLVRLLLLFGVAVVATVISFAVVSHISGPRLLPGGSAAPSIQTTAAGGDAVALFGPDSARERPVVLEFFETTCAVCQQEVQAMCDLHRRHPGADFFSVNAAREDANAVKNFAQSHGSGCTTWPLLLDPKSDILRAYSVTVVPTVYVVDTRGRIVYSGTGAGGVDGLDKALQSLGANG